MVIIEPGFIQIDIPLTGTLFTVGVAFYLVSLTVRFIVSVLKSIPFF